MDHFAESVSYQPIDCNFYDVLLDKATRRSICVIHHRTAAGMVISTGQIMDIYTRSGEEFMRLSGGEVIRLDHLAAIDGQVPPIFHCTR